MIHPFFLLWLKMLEACYPPTPEQRRQAFRVIEGGKDAA